MGEVYRARDTKLLRDLALKVLPIDVATDVDRLIRFEREARSASALNHPNIVTIYEIGRFDTMSYIAMELVAGRTLRDVLMDGPLPIRRFIAIAAQIADGLARAHDAGIVHRDFKPENVMITREGMAKILDFGLAKLVGDHGHSQLATVSQTTPGLVQGTVAYMSPEQASGKAVDSRSDQFSLGAVLVRDGHGASVLSLATRTQRHWPRSYVTNRSHCTPSFRIFHLRCDGRSSVAWPRIRMNVTPRPAISRATWRNCVTTSPELLSGYPSPHHASAPDDSVAGRWLFPGSLLPHSQRSQHSHCCDRSRNRRHVSCGSPSRCLRE